MWPLTVFHVTLNCSLTLYLDNNHQIMTMTLYILSDKCLKCLCFGSGRTVRFIHRGWRKARHFKVTLFCWKTSLNTLPQGTLKDYTKYVLSCSSQREQRYWKLGTSEKSKHKVKHFLKAVALHLALVLDFDVDFTVFLFNSICLSQL